MGRLETAGRPIQYSTTFAFLQHFGLRGLEDMPPLQPEEVAVLEAMATNDQLVAPSEGQSAASQQVPPPADPPVAVTDAPVAINDQLSLPGAAQSIAAEQTSLSAAPSIVVNGASPDLNDQLPLTTGQV